jgi:hypothetical protein
MDVQQITRKYAGNAAAMERAQQHMEQLLARSATDREFRRKLVDDPRSAVAEFSGREIPESFNVRFVENKPGGVTLVLPEPVDPAAEISEEELAVVAGGATTSPVCSVLATIALTLWAWDEFVERDK